MITLSSQPFAPQATGKAKKYSDDSDNEAVQGFGLDSFLVVLLLGAGLGFLIWVTKPLWSKFFNQLYNS